MARILSFVAAMLIVIGDGVLFVLCLLLIILKKIQKGLIFLFQKVRHTLKKRSLRRKRGVFFSITPLSTKLKYFLVGIFFSFIFIFLPLLIVTLIQSLPSPSSLGQQQFPQTTKIYDRNHHLLYQFYANQNRTLVPLSDIPKYLQEATIAIEDKNFYKNPGFDIMAIIRAALSDLSHHHLQGGSTLTQQLIKSALLTSDRSLQRKFQEIVLAFWSEHIYAKDQILDMYFNEVPYGGTAWGVEAAAQTYFAEHAKDLDLAQSAFLAGLPQAPSEYSPYGSTPTLWKARQKDVLEHMRALNYITQKQENDALAEQLTFEPQETPLLAPHFVMYIKDLLVQKYGLPLVEKGGLTVITSLDLPTQQAAQKIVADEVAKDGYLHLTNGAALVTNPQNGDILAMVGSSNYNNPDWGAVNVTTSLRQPGSSIKIVTYAAALSHGFTPATIINDSPISFPGDPPYTPVNYDGKFHGNVSLRIAFANSFNIPAVKTLQAIGIDTFVSTGRSMGLSSLEDANNYGLSVTLGSPDVTMLQMATVYGTVANSGARVDLNPILKVTDNNGDVLEEKMPATKNQVLDPGVAFLVSDILADNNARSWEFGTNSPLFIPGHRVSVKTGTTNDIRDNWTIGYTPQKVVTVWVGNNDNSPMENVASGITGAAPIWHGIMQYLLQNTKDAPLHIPTDVVTKSCMGKTEYFISGTENSVNCSPVYPTWTPTPQP
ncbi:MAG TPA: PBP1A family penicillin-binding protein [Candidatus Saccharimonadales bacterium]|nr:PBP1A family penicillin-binding protein [Candidatus Saccharimonadales bacterium]